MFATFKKFFGGNRPAAPAAPPVSVGVGRAAGSVSPSFSQPSPPRASGTPAPARSQAPARTVAPADGKGISLGIPLQAILARLPADLLPRVLQKNAGDEQLQIPMQAVLDQIGQGAVKLPFGELRRLSPPGTFTQESDRDASLVEIPLHEILSRINPSLLSRRPAQRKVEVPADITGPFDSKSPANISIKRFKTAEPEPAPAPTSMPAARPEPEPEPSQFRVPPAGGSALTAPAGGTLPDHSAPIPATGIPFSGFGSTTEKAEEPIFFRKTPATAAAVPAPIAAPAPPPQPAAPVDAPIKFNPNPVSAVTSPAPAVARPAPAPAPISRPAAIPIPAPAPAPIAAAPVTAAAIPSGSGGETRFLTIALSEVAPTWPPSVQQEIATHQLQHVTLGLPFGLVENAIRRGKVAFHWKSLRSWMRPPNSLVSSPLDELLLEIPLKSITPVFMAALKASRPQTKTEVDVNIPDLFYGKPVPPPQAPAVPFVPTTNVAPEASPLAHTDDTGHLSLQAASPETQEAPEEEISPTLKPGGLPNTAFLERYATPTDIVAKVAALPGIAGVLIALPDGLLVASHLPREMNADTLAAFLPQMYTKVGQCTRELKLGDLDNLSFTVGNVPWRLFRVGSLFVAAFGRAGESLPADKLATAVAELDRKRK